MKSEVTDPQNTTEHFPVTLLSFASPVSVCVMLGQWGALLLGVPRHTLHLPSTSSSRTEDLSSTP
ncbi:hypothetical protein E2C01_086268 [Portunus trituberculatus]|uniref:Uncharacterized protein n=1 Tax=Portunus trituberculatus TaxID=210409 RepID=A0A5B7JFW7_PORTR|nr:hypothetical protein [Portunus trituberculatus]